MVLRSHLDATTRQRIGGWAWETDRTSDAIEVNLIVDGHQTASVMANTYREDLEVAGIGIGRHAFSFDPSALALPLAESVVHVQDAATGADLDGSPIRLEAPLELDDPTRQAMIGLLQTDGTDEALKERALFLAEQTNSLLQRLADRQSSRKARASARSRKWRWQASDGPEPASMLPRALVIDNAVPVKARDAGSNVIISHMLSLQRLGLEVTFLSPNMQSGSGADDLRAAGIIVPSEPWSATVEEVLRRQSGEFDLVYLHRIEIAQRYLQLARHYAPKARIIYSIADLHHLRLSRQYEAEDRPEGAAQVAQMRMQEMLAAAASHAVLTHSDVEAELLRRALPKSNIIVVPWVIPLRPTSASFANRSGVAFLGNYQHTPNVDAAMWLADEIMPLVWARLPDVVCVLAGSAMPNVLRAKRDPRIVPLGHVQDLNQVFGRVRLTVAPLAYGAGLKGKVAESLAAGVPCVCTSVAAEGFDLPEALLGLKADDSEGLANSIVHLHSNERTFLACQSAGLNLIQKVFNETVVDTAIRRAAGLAAV